MRYSLGCVSLNVDPIAHHPDIQLLQPVVPARLERPHPLAVGDRVGHIHDQERQAVVVDDFFMPPVTLGDIPEIARELPYATGANAGPAVSSFWPIPF